MADTKTTNTQAVKVLSRVVKLTYLQSQQVRGGGRDLGELSGEGGGVGNVSGGKSKSSAGFLGFGASSSSTSFFASDSGWVISRVWEETYFDKVRYAIGIRDVGIFNYRFAEVSEFVSKPFRSPKELAKVSLRVVEQIPGAYPLGPRYIEYYITPDDGKTWHQINPLDHPTITGSDGLVIPRIITFNAEIGGDGGELQKFVETDEPVKAIRLRVVTRGSQDVESPDRHTPVLKRYRLLMYPRGGL